MFNQTLVGEGYAQVATFPPNVKYTDRFLEAQRDAGEVGRGLWGLHDHQLCQQTGRGNGIGAGATPTAECQSGLSLREVHMQRGEEICTARTSPRKKRPKRFSTGIPATRSVLTA
jgi:hypothetical protein